MHTYPTDIDVYQTYRDLMILAANLTPREVRVSFVNGEVWFIELTLSQFQDLQARWKLAITSGRRDVVFTYPLGGFLAHEVKSFRVVEQ